jgi:3-methyladenine DNA glycosylase AlkD
VARAYRGLPLEEIGKLIQSPFHEHRLIALLILVGQHRRADVAQKVRLHRFCLDHLQGINSWDLVDTSAATLVGEHIADDAKLLRRLATSEVLWHRRIAMVSTFAELRAGRTALTFRIAKQLLSDKQELIHKAVGWLLREAGKCSQPELLQFLRRNYNRLPRTTLRYAIERLDPVERKKWLGGPQ